jgi:hypothetical protein
LGKVSDFAISRRAWEVLVDASGKDFEGEDHFGSDGRDEAGEADDSTGVV